MTATITLRSDNIHLLMIYVNARLRYGWQVIELTTTTEHTFLWFYKTIYVAEMRKSSAPPPELPVLTLNLGPVSDQVLPV